MSKQRYQRNVYTTMDKMRKSRNCEGSRDFIFGLMGQRRWCVIWLYIESGFKTDIM